VPENGIEFWFARDLQEPLGYARWENFIVAISRAIASCKTTGYNPDNHFRGVTKMVVKKLERRLKTEEKRLEHQAGRLPGGDSLL
jgi:hypothetical protein